MKKRIARLIWNLSEQGHLPPLGKYAPIVFGWMIGSKGERYK